MVLTGSEPICGRSGTGVPVWTMSGNAHLPRTQVDASAPDTPQEWCVGVQWILGAERVNERGRGGREARDRVGRMSVGDVAGLIAAVAFVLLVGVLAIPLVKLGGVLDETRSMIKGVSDETVPLLSEVTTTVSTTNAQLVRVDAITSNVQAATTNVSALTALLAATLGGPVVKVAAFTYGVRSALADRPGARTRRKVADQTLANKAAARAAKRRKAD